MRVGGQHHTPAPLPTSKDPVPIVQETGWAPRTIWTGVENLAPPLPGFDPRTVQPVASRYTDWAIPALYIYMYINMRIYRPKENLML